MGLRPTQTPDAWRVPTVVVIGGMFAAGCAPGVTFSEELALGRYTEAVCLAESSTEPDMRLANLADAMDVKFAFRARPEQEVSELAGPSAPEALSDLFFVEYGFVRQDDGDDRYRLRAVGPDLSLSLQLTQGERPLSTVSGSVDGFREFTGETRTVERIVTPGTPARDEQHLGCQAARTIDQAYSLLLAIGSVGLIRRPPGVHCTPVTRHAEEPERVVIRGVPIAATAPTASHLAEVLGSRHCATDDAVCLNRTIRERPTPHTPWTLHLYLAFFDDDCRVEDSLAFAIPAHESPAQAMNAIFQGQTWTWAELRTLSANHQGAEERI